MSAEFLTIGQRFYRARQDMPGDPGEILTSGMIAVGMLLGADMPGAAAAVSLLLEHRFPGATNFSGSEQ